MSALEQPTTCAPPRKHPCWSSINAYQGCPWRFYACYVRGDPGIATPAINTGGLCDEVAERYARHCFTKRRKSDLEEGRRILTGYPEQVQKNMEQWIEDWRWEWGATIVEGVAPVQFELRAKLPGGMEFSGHLDLLQRYEEAATASPFGDDDEDDRGDGARWVVTDFAAHWYDKSQQLRIYAWLVQQNYPEARSIEVRVEPFAGRWRGGPDMYMGSLECVGHELQAICDRIAADEEHEPNPGPACLTCLHTLTCPLRETGTMKAVLGDSGEDALRKLLWHQGQGKQLKAILDARYYAGETPEADGYKWGPQETKPSFALKDDKPETFLAAVQLAFDARDEMQVPRSRLSAVARLLKLEGKVAGTLATSEVWRERALEVFKYKPPGKPRIGLVRAAGAEGADEEDGTLEPE